MVLPDSAQKQIFMDKNFRGQTASHACIYSVGEKFHGRALTCEIRENFQP